MADNIRSGVSARWRLSALWGTETNTLIRANYPLAQRASLRLPIQSSPTVSRHVGPCALCGLLLDHAQSRSWAGGD